MTRNQLMATVALAWVRHCLCGCARMRVEVTDFNVNNCTLFIGFFSYDVEDERDDRVNEVYETITDVPIAWLPFQYEVYGDKRSAIGRRSRKRWKSDTWWKLLPGMLLDIASGEWTEYTEGVHHVDAYWTFSEDNEAEVMLSLLPPLGKKLQNAMSEVHNLYYENCDDWGVWWADKLVWANLEKFFSIVEEKNVEPTKALANLLPVMSAKFAPNGAEPLVDAEFRDLAFEVYADIQVAKKRAAEDTANGDEAV